MFIRGKFNIELWENNVSLKENPFILTVEKPLEELLRIIFR
jgi:hypothetical protein